MGLGKYSQRVMWKRPGRTILTILSIVIGVAAVVAVTVMTATTRSAYKEMFAVVTGRSALVVEGVGQSTLPTELVEKIGALPGVKAAVPVMQRDSVIYAKEERIRLRLLGVDPERDSMIRDYEITAGEPLSGGKELLLDEAFARRLHVKVNDEVRIASRIKGRVNVRIVGILAARGSTTLQQAGLALIPLPLAQSMFASADEVDVIQIVAESKTEVESVQSEVSAILPVNAKVRPPAGNTQAMQQMMQPAEEGLRISSIFSIVLSSFIILNTFLMNVGERRRQLSILRAIGATSRQILTTILRESVVLGLVGSVIGLGIGLALGYALNYFLSQTLEVELPAMELSALPFVLAIVLGLGMSVVGAIVPAWRAGKVSPLEGMDRVSRADQGEHSWYFVLAGIIMLAASAAFIVAILLGLLSPDFGVVAGIGLLIGPVFLSPKLLAPFSKLVVLIVRPLLHVEGNLAIRQILRHRTRSSLTSGVLFVAGCAGVAMASAILDNLAHLRRWHQVAIPGDFFIRSMLPDFKTGHAPNLPDELGPDLERLERTKSLEGVSWVTIEVNDLKPLAVGRQYSSNGPLPFDFLSGDPNLVRSQLAEGQVVISGILAQKIKVAVGDNLEVDSADGKKSLRICAIVTDYMGGGITVHMHRDTLVSMFNTQGFDAFILRVDHKDLKSVGEELQQICDQHGVLLHSHVQITSMIDTIAAKISLGLWILVVLGFVVAAFGIANTLTMSVLEQTRELGLMRIVAMTKGQVRRTILTQALIIGSVGFVPGVLVGMSVAYIINVLMPAAIGRSVAFGFHPWLMLGTLGCAMLITGIAAWIPAQRAANLDLVQALHYE